MLVADGYVGHRDDDGVAERLADADFETVVLSDTDRQRSRVRTETESGEDIGIVVARDLGDGDVLETDEGLVVVELARIDALVVDVAGADIEATAALELGHALGNRHWDLAVRDGEALFPVPDTRERMDATVAELLPDGIDTRYEAVPPTTFDDAGADHAHGDHGHSHGEGHSHAHEESHAHDDHAHDGDGHGHSHDSDGHGHAHDGGVRTVDGGES